MIDENNTFSPNINQKSRGISRTIKDLYSWNDMKENKIIKKKEKINVENSSYKISMWPGSINIINNLDDLGIY